MANSVLDRSCNCDPLLRSSILILAAIQREMRVTYFMRITEIRNLPGLEIRIRKGALSNFDIIDRTGDAAPGVQR